MLLFFIEIDIERILSDIDTDMAFFRFDVCDCVHNSPLLHSGSRPLRLFELKGSRCSATRLSTGLAKAGPVNDSSCYTGNLVVQVTGFTISQISRVIVIQVNSRSWADATKKWVQVTGSTYSCFTSSLIILIYPLRIPTF